VRAIATYILHYGAEYLGYSIRSIVNYVDEVAVWYASVPSFGHGARNACPEGVNMLYDIARKAAGDKLTWCTGGTTLPYANESQHRGAVLDYARKQGYDVAINLDADEVWSTEGIQETLAQVENGRIRHARNRVPMIHFWQGFDLACYDGCQPVRIYLLKVPSSEGEADIPSVFHFGYAISDELMKYKWEIHGHKNELRKDWMEQRWLARASNDVHPTNENYWNAVPFSRERLPEIMKGHPKWQRRS
jgi:hypothetical protein